VVKPASSARRALRKILLGDISSLESTYPISAIGCPSLQIMNCAPLDNGVAALVHTSVYPPTGETNFLER
jgi:hypothetical protein